MWREAFAHAKSQNTLSRVQTSRFVRRPCGGVHCIIIGSKTQFYSPSADNAHYILYILFSFYDWIALTTSINPHPDSNARVNGERKKLIHSHHARSAAALQTSSMEFVTKPAERKTENQSGKTASCFTMTILPLQTAYAENDDLPAYYSSNLTGKFTRFLAIHARTGRRIVLYAHK